MNSVLLLLEVVIVYAFTIPKLTITASQSPKSLTLELIHRDSIHSPLYPGPETSAETFKRQVRPIMAHYESKVLGSQNVHIRPTISYRYSMEFLVRVGIGNPLTYVYLLLDTASSLIWTQCKPCNPCFPQHGDMLNPVMSRSYKALPCNHSLCKPPRFGCKNGKCVYNIRYEGNRSSEGDVATEEFTFNSKNNRTQTVIPGIIFGCGYKNNKRMFVSNRVGGMIGMNLKEVSLIKQLLKYTGHPYAFSHCLPNHINDVGYLRFGKDTISHKVLQSTPFINHKSDYYMQLTDIGVNGQRLHLPKGSFDTHVNGSGGCILDTGSNVSVMNKEPYARVKQGLIAYFKRFNLTIVHEHQVADLCYRWPKGFNSFPYMEYVFDHGRKERILRVEGENVFAVMRETNMFCSYLLPNSKYTIIGAPFLRNLYVSYDIEKNMVAFGKEDCARYM